MFQIPLLSLCTFNYTFLSFLSTCSSFTSLPSFPAPQIALFALSHQHASWVHSFQQQISINVTPEQLKIESVPSLKHTGVCSAELWCLQLLCSVGQGSCACPKENCPSAEEVKPFPAFPVECLSPVHHFVSLSHT